MLKYFLLVLLTISTAYSQNFQRIFLNTNWQFTEMGADNWMPATVPGTVHTDLHDNKIISEPFFGENEKTLKWIEEKDWEYKTVFSVDEKTLSAHNIEIVFEGIDTYAHIYLNDSLFIRANNMFRSWQCSCKEILKKQDNILNIKFFSPIRISDSLASLYGVKLPGGNHVYIRKAPYHFGWDWGPRFVTSGIWRPVYISAWNDIKIEDVSFQQRKITREQAELHVPYFLNCYTKDLYTISVKDVSNNIIYAEKSDSLFEGYNLDFFDFNLYNPRLWWTRELGTPEIYSFRFEVRRNNYVVDEKIYHIGIRKIELIREKDSIGESFYFKLNDVPLFIKGANYIPQDNFLPRVKKERYEMLIKNCYRSNINMLRVWGGGVYEDDEFYSQCDFNGILVWQDFMFACAMYPGDSAFLKNVQVEVFQNISRLKNHPCIALWCGNNEIDEGWNNWGWQKEYGYSKKDSVKIWNDYQKIFNRIIPEALENILPSSNYIPSSPEIGWGNPESMKKGDSHYWGVWWGNEPFEIYKNKVPRFMSEYGFQSFPDLKTIESFTLPVDKYLYSDVMKNHQKHPAGYETIQKYLEYEYRQPESFEEYIYISQLLQAYGVRTAIESHRRAKPYCMGTMYWQLNDCWPVVSWSSTDYFGRWKALQYFVKDAYRQILVSPVEEKNHINVYIVSDYLNQLYGTLHMQLQDFSGNILWYRDTDVKIPENSSGVYFSINKKELISEYNINEIVLSTELELLSGSLYKNHLYFVRPKEMNLQRPEISIIIKEEGSGITLMINSDKLVKNLFLYSDEDIYFSKNYFDILPNNAELVYCKTSLSKGDFEKKLKYIFLNNR